MTEVTEPNVIANASFLLMVVANILKVQQKVTTKK